MPKLLALAAAAAFGALLFAGSGPAGAAPGQARDGLAAPALPVEQVGYIAATTIPTMPGEITPWATIPTTIVPMDGAMTRSASCKGCSHRRIGRIACDTTTT